MARLDCRIPLGAISLLCKLWVAGLGILTIAGWVANVEVLASLRANYIPMAPSTAVAFGCLGLAVSLPRRSRAGATLAKMLIGSVAALALLKLLEFFLRTSFGIDELFVANPEAFGHVSKGRMSPITAACFLLAGAAISASRSQRFADWAGFLATALLGINTVVLLGYLHGTPVLYGATIIPVALPTATAFFLLGLSVIIDNGEQHWPSRAFVGNSAKAVLLRWFLPVVVVLATLTDLLRARALHSLFPNPAILSAVSALVFVIAISAIISQVARIVGGRIDQAEAERNAAQRNLEALNDRLEETVEKRTHELRVKSEQMEEELQMARELQFAMLPKRFPRIPEDAPTGESLLGFFTLYLPTSQVSGDFFNVFPVSETSVGVLVCDVMGHGVRAALVAGMMRALTEQHAGSNCDPGNLLARLNDSLHSLLRHSGTTMFATGLVVIVDAAGGRYSYASAGHPKPLHYHRSEGRTACLGEASGPALGLFKGARFTTATGEIAPGDLLMLFTDGLFEVENPESGLYSHADLVEEVRKHSGLPAPKLMEEVVREVRQFAGGADFEDDVCLVGIELRSRS